MKRRMAGFLLAFACFCGPLLALAETNSVPQPASQPGAQKVPGYELAQTLSTITGVAISPLFGVGAVGAWQYYHAKTPEQQARLHWYANPWFWIPALSIVLLCFLKDVIGAGMPNALKKPFDIAEAIENKISGLVATGAFVPLAVQLFERPETGAWLGSLGFAAIDSTSLVNALAILGSMVVFFLVFLASNAINVLILLSPFSTVDAALKLFRMGLLASVVATSWLNPWIGGAWALIIILVACLIVGWSFRLSYFGLTYIRDLVTRRSDRFVPDAVANKMFLARKIENVPARTWGRLTRNNEGRLVFNYHPWLILPLRTVTLPEGRYEAGRGLIYSEIQRIEGEAARTILLLPPRYSGHEESLASIYGLAGVREIGLRAAWKWLKDFFVGRPQPQPV